jgi:hypothetical protein
LNGARGAIPIMLVLVDCLCSDRYKIDDSIAGHLEILTSSKSYSDRTILGGQVRSGAVNKERR